MNWLAVKEEENNFSIRAQHLLSLTEICILSFTGSLKNSYKSNSSTLDREGITKIVDYLRTFPYFSNSSRYILPFWISDRILNHILADEDCPITFFTDFFSEQVCSLSNLNIQTMISSELLHSRFTHLKSCTISTLDFSNNLNITDSLFHSLNSSKLTDSLRTINLRGCTSFNHISSLFCFHNLVDLDVSENESIHWGDVSCLKALSVILSSFTQLQRLDLHLTNIFTLTSTSTQDSDIDMPTDLNLQELYLHMDPVSLESPDTILRQRTILLYRAFSNLTSLTHLDLSGWPFLEDTPVSLLINLSKRLTFFGLYQTPITKDKVPALSLHCKEISGLSETCLATAIMHYSKHQDYLKSLFIHVFSDLIDKQVILSHDLSLQLIPLILDALDHYISIIPTQDAPSSWSSLDLLISCSACLYALSFYMKDKMSDQLIRRSIETSITLLYRVGVRELSTFTVGQLVANTCSIYSLFAHIHTYKQSHQTMHYALCRFFLTVVESACDVAQQPQFIGSILPRILDRTLRILYTLLFGLDVAQKAYVGIQLGGVDTLMRLIEIKSRVNALDNDLHHASGALMNITYLCLQNCLRLSKREHSEILVRVLAEMSPRRELIALIMACIENIAEFCLQEESAGVSGQLLTPVITVLKNHSKYNQDAISCAIAFTAYFSMGHEKWGWSETGEEVLSLATEVLNQLDYRLNRSVSYNTLDFLVECLSARDGRILLCALWIICNLVYKNPEYYLDMLNETAISSIRELMDTQSKDSLCYKLASEVIKLVEITRKCAEFK